jgi:alpha-aminoadipic semialdehyde synthase
LAHHYPSIAAAKKAFKITAQEIADAGLPSEIERMNFVFLGDGNVSQGAQEIMKVFPVSFVSPREYLDKALGKSS